MLHDLWAVITVWFEVDVFCWCIICVVWKVGGNSVSMGWPATMLYFHKPQLDALMQFKLPDIRLWFEEGCDEHPKVI